VTTQSSSTRLRRVEARSELCIVVACHTFVSAIPVRFVTRLVLVSDVSDAADAGPGLVRSGGELFVRADLGTLLELPPLASAYAVLHVPHAGGVVPIALSTGTCLVVREVAVEAPLPQGLFKARADAVRGAFVADSSRGFAGGVLYGLVLDLPKLWTPTELDAAARLLAKRARRQADV